MPTLILRLNLPTATPEGEENHLFVPRAAGLNRPRWRAFAGSLCFHVVFFLGAPYLPIFGGGRAVDRQQQVRVIEMIHLRVPDELYFHSPRQEQREAGKGEKRALAAGPAKQEGSAGPAVAALSEPAGEPAAREVNREPTQRNTRQFQLPPEVRRVPSETTLLFPDLPPDQTPAKLPPVPTLAVWAKLPKPKKPEAKRFIPPAEEARNISMPIIEDTPVLATPSREQDLASIRVASRLMTQEAKLQRPPATQAPLRAFAPPASQRLDPSAAPRMEAPDAATFLSMSNSPIPKDGKLSFEAGNQVSPWHEQAPRASADGAGSGGTAKGEGVNGAGAGTRSEGVATGAGTARNTVAAVASAGGGASNARDAGGSGGRDSAHGETGTGPDSASSGKGQNASGRGSGSSGSGVGAGTKDSVLIGGVVVTKMLFPNTQVNDVVVQSLSGEVLPEGIGILSGRPVYTVFLPVGRPRKWIMQYCLMAQKRTEDNPPKEVRVVRLGAPAPLKAPYPMEAYEPPPIASDGAKYWLIHGALEADGGFEGLRVVNGDAERTGILIQALARWQFRPASQDGRAVKVEFLIAVPTGLQ